MAPKGDVCNFNFTAVETVQRCLSATAQMLGLSEVLKPGELIQVAGYVFVQGTTHPLQLLLDQSPRAFDGIGVCTTVGVKFLE